LHGYNNFGLEQARLAEQQADEQIKKVAAKRDQANKKLKGDEAREAAIRKQALEQAEKKHQKALLDRRRCLPALHAWPIRAWLESGFYPVV